MEPSQSAMSRNSSQSNNIDPLEGLIDFSEYDAMNNYNSPSVTPVDSNKQQFAQPDVRVSRANSILPSNHQTLSGPSHPYDMHKQQTGIPTGGLATTMAINSNYQMYAGNGFLSGVSPASDFVDVKYGSNPPSGSFDSVPMNDYDAAPVDPAFFFPPMPIGASGSGFVKPSSLTNNDAAMQQHASNVGRLWPGMHQQQAMAKAQQSQRQQRMMPQQRQGSVASQPAKKSRPSTDPLVEEKIAQLLNSMRQKSDVPGDDEDADGSNHNSSGQRSRKGEEDMDEDERLLASEEGKKLSSKERRQLRNKVSARAFRSRRKGKI